MDWGKKGKLQYDEDKYYEVCPYSRGTWLRVSLGYPGTGIPLQWLHKTSQDQNKKEKKQRTEKKRVTKLNVQRFVFPIILNTFTWSWWLPILCVCRSAHRVERWASLHFGTRLTSTCLRSRHLHVVEKHIRTMVFWTSFPPVPPHFVDWHRHRHRCYRSESSDRRIWWRSRWWVL